MTRALTDLGNAERLADLHGRHLRAVASWNKWLVWDDRRWRIDETLEAEARAKDTVRAIYTEASSAETQMERESLVKHAVRSEGDARVRAMLSRAMAERSLAVRADTLDADPWLLNLMNGTLDLRTQQLHAHRREDRITKLMPVTYDREATCPRWEAFLQTIMQGSDELVQFLQTAFGYTLTGMVSEQCLFFCYGKGANGKSTVLDTLRGLLGEYGSVADFSTFLDRKQDGPRNDIARLAGSRMVTAIEAGDGHRLAESVVKNLTGGDKITARLLYREAFEFVPTFKLWLATNHKPVIRGTDLGIWRRIRMIPFAHTVKDEDKVPDFAATFIPEWPGILNWALAGLERWLDRGAIVQPEAVADATSEYKEESDVLGAFLLECCEFGRDFSCAASDLYTAYVRWSEAGREYTMTQTKFGRALEERDIRSLKTSGHAPKRRVGLRLLGGQSGTVQGVSQDSSIRARTEDFLKKPSTVPNPPPPPELDFESWDHGDTISRPT